MSIFWRKKKYPQSHLFGSEVSCFVVFFCEKNHNNFFNRNEPNTKTILTTTWTLSKDSTRIEKKCLTWFWAISTVKSHYFLNDFLGQSSLLSFRLTSFLSSIQCKSPRDVTTATITATNTRRYKSRVTWRHATVIIHRNWMNLRYNCYGYIHDWLEISDYHAWNMVSV